MVPEVTNVDVCHTTSPGFEYNTRLPSDWFIKIALDVGAKNQRNEKIDNF